MERMIGGEADEEGTSGIGRTRGPLFVLYGSDASSLLECGGRRVAMRPSSYQRLLAQGWATKACGEGSTRGIWAGGVFGATAPSTWQVFNLGFIPLPPRILAAALSGTSLPRLGDAEQGKCAHPISTCVGRGLVVKGPTSPSRLAVGSGLLRDVELDVHPLPLHFAPWPLRVHTSELRSVNSAGTRAEWALVQIDVTLHDAGAHKTAGVLEVAISAPLEMTNGIDGREANLVGSGDTSDGVRARVNARAGASAGEGEVGRGAASARRLVASSSRRVRGGGRFRFVLRVRT
eukprot:90344-Pleurochrysis_carterae.AAC.1